MPRSPEANREIRDERRQQILRAAALVFARDGFAAAQMEDVAREAGVSKGLLYHYFESKPALFTAIIGLVADGVTRLQDEALKRPGRAAERLAWLVAQEVAGIRDREHMFTLVLGAFQGTSVPAEAQDRAAALTRSSGRVLEALIAAGQAEGDVIDGDPGELAALLGYLLSGHALGAATPALRGATLDARALTGLFLRR